MTLPKIPKIHTSEPHTIMQQYYKEYATINGNIVQDKEVKKISDENGSIIMGHNGPNPFIIREMFSRKNSKTRKSQKNKKKRKTKTKSTKKRT
jgi:hypothetical protein